MAKFGADCSKAVMFYINDSLFALDTAALQREINALPAWRRDVVLRYRQELNQRQSLLAYKLLCDGLRQDFGIATPPRFEIGAHGKPHLPDYPQLHFNLSHCREAVACVIDTRPVGIDIETFRPLKESVLQYAMSSEEILRIHASEQPERTFTLLWTQKEALVKLTGEGITDNLPTLLEHASHTLHSLATDRYICSIAY